MINIGNAPCSWGVLEFDLEGEAAGYAQVLDEMQESGYAGTEFGDWGFLPTDPVKLKAELRSRDLKLLGAFVPVLLKDPQAHTAGQATALRTARLLNQVEGDLPFIILADDNGKDPVRTQNAGRIQPEMGLSSAEWKYFAEGAQGVAETVLRETGLRTVFHHHCAGYIETPQEIDSLLRLTDPQLLGLCLDTGHYKFGGGDPSEAIKKHARRIWHVHFKDCHPEVAGASRQEGWDYFTSVRNGIFSELGTGDVDFPSIKEDLLSSGYHGWIVVEQDVLPGTGSPKESAIRNREYLRTLGF